MARSKPFQVNLDPQQHRHLRALSERRGISMGSLVRESVAQYLAGEPTDEDPLLQIVGLFEDTGAKPYGDVGEEHDRYLADIIARVSDETVTVEPFVAIQRGKRARTPPGKP